MKAENYLTIQGWMRTVLGLTGNDLIAFAIIYQFSQTEEQRYTGGRQYLADWCGCSKQGIDKNLKKLTEKGLIVKSEKLLNGVKFCEYTVDNSVVPCTQLSGSQLSCPNNKDIIYSVSNKSNSSSSVDNNTDSKQSNVTKENVFIERFDRFWKAYPVKAGKGEARKAWLKLKPSEELTNTMIKAVERARREDDRWLNGYIPNPATWLNQARWDDEPVKPKVPRNPNKILSERDVKEDEFETGFYADIMNRKRST